MLTRGPLSRPSSGAVAQETTPRSVRETARPALKSFFQKLYPSRGISTRYIPVGFGVASRGDSPSSYARMARYRQLWISTWRYSGYQLAPQPYSRNETERLPFSDNLPLEGDQVWRMKDQFAPKFPGPHWWQCQGSARCRQRSQGSMREGRGTHLNRQMIQP